MPILSGSEFFKGGAPKRSAADTSANRDLAPAVGKPGFLERLKGFGQDAAGDILQTGKGIVDSVTKRSDAFNQGVADTLQGKQNPVETAFQLVGNAAGGAADIANEVFTGAAKVAAPQSVEDSFSETVASAAAPIVTSEPIQAIISKYESVKQTNPQLARDIDAALGLGSFAATLGGGLVAKDAAQVAQRGASAIKTSVDDVAKSAAASLDDLERAAVSGKDSLIDRIAGLDDKTKTALKRTPQEKFQEVVSQGRNALLDDRNRTPLELVGDDMIAGLKQVKSQAGSIGQQKSEYLNQAKVGLKRTGNIARDARTSLRSTFNGLKLDKSDVSLIKEIDNELKALGKNPNLKEVDKTVDFLQDKLYTATRSNAVEVTDRVTGPLRRVVEQLNSGAKEVGGTAYKRLNEQYAERIRLVLELNARLGKEGASAGSFVKRLFSPSDARTKALFDQLQKLTGQDFTRDARLAKFVMDALGDTRAGNFLDQIPTSALGAVGKAAEFVASKVSDPLKNAKRFINKQ